MLYITQCLTRCFVQQSQIHPMTRASKMKTFVHHSQMLTNLIATIKVWNNVCNKLNQLHIINNIILIQVVSFIHSVLRFG